MEFILIILTNALVIFISLYIGFYLGTKTISEERAKTLLPKISFNKRKLGAVQKLSQTEIEKKGTRLQETEEAMIETLKDLM